MAAELDSLTLERARRGDPKAIAALVRFYERPVFALVGRLMCGRRAAAVEDVAQEVFVRVVRAIGRFEPSGSARLSTWILTIATRACLNQLRGAFREEPMDALGEVAAEADVASPEAMTLDRERETLVVTAMAALPEQMRAVLVLRAYHDLDYPEIAAALDLEIGTVKSRLARARLALREALLRQDKEQAS